MNLAYIPSPPAGVWHLGPVPVRAYALCIIVGIIAACWWGDKRWVARGGKPGQVIDIAVWAVPFGLVGGRLYHVITDFSTYFGAHGKGLGAAFAVWDGGLGIWGAVALGVVGGAIGCRRNGISVGDFADALAPCILLAQAIGRIGNYFNQELYGAVTTLPWGLEIFYRENAQGYRGPGVIDGTSTGEVYSVVQPTFLYELLWNLLIVGALVLVDRRFVIRRGRLFMLYVAGYCLGRFFIELMREDHATHVLGLRINTITSTVVFIAAVLWFVFSGRRRASSSATGVATGAATGAATGPSVGSDPDANPGPDSDTPPGGDTDPGNTDSGDTDPGNTDSGDTDPGNTDSGDTNPGDTNPGAAGADGTPVQRPVTSPSAEDAAPRPSED